MTATVHTAIASTRACLVLAALLAGVATSSAHAAVAQQQQPDANRSTVVANAGTVVAGYSYAGKGNAGIVGSHESSARGAEVAGHSGAGLQLAADPSLLVVAALGALCLSLSWRRPASRHAEKLRERLGNGEAASGAGAQG